MARAPQERTSYVISSKESRKLGKRKPAKKQKGQKKTTKRGK